MKSSMPDSYAAFEDEVKTNFSFLEQQYGYRLTHSKQVGLVKVIRYESSLVYVNLMYGPPAYEPEMAFGRIGIDDVPGAYSFHPGDLIQLKSSSGWRWDPTNPNNSAFVEIISGLAQVLRECGSACLLGDQASFEEMKARRDGAMKAWHQKEKASHVRKDAESAWRNKDYSVVVNLYESIKDILTQVEKKKLDYARKWLTNSSRT